MCNCRYGCMYDLAVFLLVCIDSMLMSSVYEVNCSGAGYFGMYALYMWKSG